MPIYEFRCRSCDARFEDLVPPGTASVACPECGERDTERRISAQAAPFRLAGSPGSQRKQEAKNAKLHAKAKADFKDRLRKTRQARRRGSSGP